MLKVKHSLVSVDWLYQHIDESNLIILDASIKKVTSTNVPTTSVQIKNARFLDLKNEFSDTSAEFPNTMLSPEKFSEAARKLGINKESTLVVYDSVGIYSSARVWWMFKAMGHQNIAVLDGGLPAWTTVGFPVEDHQTYSGKLGDFSADYNSEFFYNYDNVLDVIKDNNKLILDARATERFHGTVPEPRKGLRSGHIPNSKSLPYVMLQENGQMKTKEEIIKLFKSIDVTDKKLVFSCGSGITACVLALGAEISGIKSTVVYDGSWTEWGTLFLET